MPLPQDIPTETLLQKANRLRSETLSVKRAPKEPVTNYSVGGFAENVLDDAFDTLKGLYQLIPSAGRAIKWVYENPDPEKIGKAGWELLVNMKDAILDPYKKYGVMGAAYHKPVSTLLDVLTVLSLGGGSVAKVGRLAGGVSRVGKAAEVIGKVGELSKADKLVRAGEYIQNLPGMLARKGIDAAAMKVGMDLPKRREFLHMKRGVLADEIAAVEADNQIVGNKIRALSEPESELFHQWRVGGAKKAELLTNPKVADALESYRVLAGQWEQILKKRGLLTDATARMTLIKKYATEVLGRPTRENLKAALEAIKKAEVKPIYGPALFEGKVGSVDDIIDSLLTQKTSLRTGKVGFLEHYKGAQGAIKDPRKYVPQAIQAFRRVEAKLRLIDEVLQNPSFVQVVSKGKANLADLLPEGIFKKYFEDKARAQAPALKRLIETRKGSAGALEAISTDPMAKKAIVEAVGVIADPTIKRLLQSEFYRVGGPIGAAIRVYDRIIRLFTTTATRWNPKWHLGNVVGNSFLYALFGGGAEGLSNFQKLAKAGKLSPEVMAKIGAAGQSMGFAGVLQRAMDIGTVADTLARGGLITRQVAQELKSAGVTFEHASELLEQVMGSTREYRRAATELQLLQEQAARRVPGLIGFDSKIERAEKLLDLQNEKISSMLEKINEAERRTGGAKRLERVVSSIEDLQEQKRILVGLFRLAKEGEARVLSISEEAIIHGLGGGRTEIVTPNPGLLGKRGRVEAKKIKNRGIEISKSIKEVQRRLTTLKAEADKIMTTGPRLTMSASVAEERQKLMSLEGELATLKGNRKAIMDDITDDFMKAGGIDELEKKMPGLKAQAELLNEATDRANTFFGEYLGLSGFEQRFMRRLIPFYAFTKAMTMLAFRLPFIAPVKTFLWHRFSMALWSQIGDPELPDYVKGYVPIFARENGDIVWLRMNALSPFSGLRRTKFGEIPLPSLLAIGEQNPLINLSYQLQGGRSVFSRTAVPYGEPMVSVANGDVYELTQDGRLRKTVPQTPLVSGIAHMFPITQLIQEILVPYEIGKYDSFGFPQPTLNPDGTYRAPRELWQRLLSMGGLSTSVKGKEDFKRGERIRMIQNLRGLKRAMKSADPREREVAREALKDWSNANMRIASGS